MVYDATQLHTAPKVEVRALLDTGSQRSYVTTRVQEALGAKEVHSEAMIIKTFGATRGEKRTCDILRLKINVDCGEILTLPVAVVPHICDPVCVQLIDIAKASYEYLAGLELADSGDAGTSLEIDLL